MSDASGFSSLHSYPGQESLEAKLRARASRAFSDASGSLVFEYEFAGDAAAVRWGQAPGPGASGRLDELWKTTCWEAFVAIPGEERYWEFNFAPSGAWNAYRFARPREGMAPEMGVIGVAQAAGAGAGDGARRWRFEARLDAALFARLAGPLEVGLTAVVESSQGRISYWALEHGGAKPDFHRRASFLAELEAAPMKGQTK